MIDHLKTEYPVQVLCQIWDCPRSSYYYRASQSGDDPVMVAAIEQILMRWPFYGYRRLHAQLQREGLNSSERVVRRILKALGGSRQVGRVRVRTTDSRHNLPRYPNRIKGMKATDPNQIWVADITYIRLGRQFIYLAIILDAYTRGVRGWHISRSLSQELTLTALQNAFAKHPPPLIFHSDQGSQYAAWLHTEVLHNACSYISMSAVGQPTENGLMERFIRTLKEEHVDYADYENNFDEAFKQIGYWLEVEYMTERIHSALDYATPAEFEALAYTKGKLPLLH